MNGQSFHLQCMNQSPSSFRAWGLPSSHASIAMPWLTVNLIKSRALEESHGPHVPESSRERCREHLVQTRLELCKREIQLK